MRLNKYIIVICLLIAGLAVFFKIALAMSIFPTREISVSAVANIIDTQTGDAGWNFEDEINEAREMLMNVELTVENKDIEYSEKRISIASGKIKVTDKKLKDAERQIA